MHTFSKSEPSASTSTRRASSSVKSTREHSRRTMRDSSRKSNLFLPSKITRLSALAGNDVAKEDMQRVGKFLRTGSLAAGILWLSMLALVWWIAPTDSYERLDRAEHHACVLVFVLLAVSNSSRLVPLLIRDKAQFLKTGAMVGSCTVQFIALASVAIMILFPTPVLMDPITGQRVHLVRWAEWTPLAFLMTFLTEGIDLPLHSNDYKRLAWKHAIAIAISTSAGLFFPFCKTIKVWMTVFVVSCVLFCSLYIRLYQRYKRFQATPRGTTVDEQEHYDRVRLSLRLLQACSIMWTVLVLGFCLCCIAPSDDEVVLLSGAGSKLRSLWASPALPLVAENFFEVGSKIWYLILVVDVHELVFDEGSRAVRRLEEMRDIMSVVWESSSDVILLCVKSEHSTIAVVSPTFLKLYNGGEEQDENIALVFEIFPNASKHDKSTPKHKVMALNMSSPVTLERVKHANYLKTIESRMTVKKNVESMTKLIIKAWDCSDEKESLLMHEFHSRSVDDGERTIKCEAKINCLDSNSLVIVLRDISERFQRFEAEKQLVVEVTERKKDAEANRFTRHEVKNGLLAAIGLVDAMRESFVRGGNEVAVSSAFSEYMASRRRGVPQFSGESSSSQSSMVRNTSELSLASSGSDEVDRRHSSNTTVAQSMAELDYTLREILDTVLSEAMARDVVHEVFEPRKERIDVVSLLNGRREASLSSSERFPLLTVPSPFPQLQLDPQILRYIHRNAVSNAVKYGQEGGQVTTEISFDDDKKEFKMKVINLPGDRHEKLFLLDAEAVKSVFAAGTRLHETLENSFSSLDEALVSSSAGDGAWIMQKCAHTLGGNCRIEFQANQTVFSLTCPAVACYPKQNNDANDLNGKTFRLPENTWGIAIDDSGIQRKLLARFLSLAGVEKSKRRVMGKDADEVLGFNDFLEETIREHPNDNFLVIVDENLDILEGGAHQKTVSGSLLVKLLRERMNPDDEKRILTLVRSANDSAEDVALYKSRAHGFLPKAPIQKDRILELIQPWWLDRFPSDTLTCGPLMEEDDQEAFEISSADLMKSVEMVDALLLGDEGSLAARWPAIREKIHALKGDLKTMQTSARVRTILEALEKLRGKSLPDEFIERWRLIRSLIVSIL